VTELRAIDSGSPIKSIARAAYEYSATYSSLVVFALLCLGWSMLAVPLHALLPRGLARRLGRRGIMGDFAFMRTGSSLPVSIASTSARSMRYRSARP